MSFTYDFATNPAIAYVRLLIPDTVNDPTKNLPIYQDEEIQAFYTIQQSTFQSSMFFSGQQGRQLPNSPVDYLRVAALAIDSLASNAAQLAAITKLLDVNLSPDKAAAALAARANQYRTTSDEAGAFVIIEQCNTTWAWNDRWWKQIQRQTGGGGL